MNVKIEPVTSWRRVVNAARMTRGKKPISHGPGEEFIRKALITQHSPIRLREYDIIIEDIPYFVSVHLVRHFMGVEKFVSSSRDDLNEGRDISRDDMPQGALVSMQLSANAQALMNISELRLCTKADKQTRKVWSAVVEEMKKVDPIMAEVMVPRCTRIGFCPEYPSCGFDRTKAGLESRHDYLKFADK